MTCIIVDDEPLAREGLELKIRQIGFLELVGQFSGGIQANQFLATNSVDLIFLDIQMPDITGIELLQTISNPPLIIFTSAFPEFAIEGYKFSAVGYLLKPIEMKEFIAAVNRANSIWKSIHLEKDKNEESQSESVFIRVDRQYIKVALDEIWYIEAMKNYAIVYTTKEKLITAISLQILMNQLPKDRFGRISKSYIVNSSFIKKLTTDAVQLENGMELPFGKTYYEPFINKFIKDTLIGRSNLIP